MLTVKNLQEKNIDNYKKFLNKKKEGWLKSEANLYKDKKIIHINATPKGGGVAEILQSLIPLERSLGLNSEWHVLEPDLRLFDITKQIHNSLQGGNEPLTKEQKNYYLECNKEFAKYIDSLNADILVIHDPQPLASIQYIQNKIPSVIRIHIDSTNPDKDTAEFIMPYINQYDKIVFTLKEFTPDYINKNNLFISPPAIDPLNAKNKPLDPDECKKIISSTGINPNKPLITQVSRFDKWKDPLGVIDAYIKAKEEIKDLQLLLMGVMESLDDPEALNVFKAVQKKAQKFKDIFLISNPKQLKGVNMAKYVNAIQRSSDIIIQKSLREGFGLTVTEAMWKEKPVIAGDTGGIRLQIKHGENGFLVSSPEEASSYIIKLMNNKGLRQQMGTEAKKSVQENFLITRMLEDEFKIMGSIIN